MPKKGVIAESIEVLSGYSAVNEWQKWKLLYFTILLLTPSFPVYLDKNATNEKLKFESSEN